MGEEENDYATKQSSLLMRSSDHLSTFKLCNEINVTSTSTSEFDCSTYFCTKTPLPLRIMPIIQMSATIPPPSQPISHHAYQPTCLSTMKTIMTI